MTTIEIKQIPDESAAGVGLSKYNMSKFPNCYDSFQAGIGVDGRWITGLDEDSRLINQIPDQLLKSQKKEEILKRRLELENITGLDLSAKSSFWDSYFIKINGRKILNFDNPRDRIDYYVLIANNYVIPDINDASHPKYAGCKFYLSRTEEEESSKAVKAKEKNKCIVLLEAMSENKPRLTLVCKFLFGSLIKAEASADSLYNLLYNFIEEDKKGERVRQFLKVAERTTEELNFKISVDEAIRYGVIRYREGYYQRGNATYGRTLDDTVTYLSKIENTAEFASIIEETNEKRILG